MAQIRGKHAVLLIITAGVALGGYAWWHAFQRGQVALRYWGSEAAVLIRYADRVELWELNQASQRGPSRRIEFQGRSYGVVRRTDISDAKGLVHARHALVEDASFAWEDRRTPRGTGNDRSDGAAFSLHFSDFERHCTVVLDPRTGCVGLAKTRQAVKLRPQLMDVFSQKSGQWSRDPLSKPVPLHPIPPDLPERD